VVVPLPSADRAALLDWAEEPIVEQGGERRSCSELSAEIKRRRASGAVGGSSPQVPVLLEVDISDPIQARVEQYAAHFDREITMDLKPLTYRSGALKTASAHSRETGADRSGRAAAR
jgi:hypothetical protein